LRDERYNKPPPEPKKPFLGKRRYRFSVNIGAIVSVLIFVLIIVVSIIFIVQNRGDPADSVTDTAQTGNPSSPDDGVISVIPEDGDFIGPIQPKPDVVVPIADYIVKTAADVFTGDLILVNSLNAYHFPEESDILSLYGNKTTSYKISDMSTSLSNAIIPIFNRMMDDFNSAKNFHEMIVISGFRDFESQKSVYDSRVASEGQEQASLYVSVPGYSEHHTGMAMDLSVYTDAGVGKALGDVEQCAWVTENAYKYGFIVRYPADKVEITKIGYEPWHFRYVGVPHAYIIESQSLCLEEYIEMLREYTWEGKRYITTDNEGKEWEIYYVKANPTGDTQIPVPINSAHQISGNNIDGYIVTVSR
jgi:D-alanyl-D-alanine carboxypeptidase